MHLRSVLVDVPPQPNSPPDSVLESSPSESFTAPTRTSENRPFLYRHCPSTHFMREIPLPKAPLTLTPPLPFLLARLSPPPNANTLEEGRKESRKRKEKEQKNKGGEEGPMKEQDRI